MLVGQTTKGDRLAHNTAGFRAASDQSLLVTLGSEINLSVHQSVVRLLRALETARVPGVLNLHPAYCSLLIRFDPLAMSHEGLEAQVRALLLAGSDGEAPEPRMVEIPVRYGGEFGPDLDEVAEICHLSPQAVIELHSSTRYTVYFLGFVPGFAYMGQLPAPINVPRLEKPRKYVPAGSVAIARDCTAVYPIPSPGGWRLIGRTDLRLFDPVSQTSSALNTGDLVRFCPVLL
jgi:KipI family sensor histidine kinase inhibitor